MRPAGAGGLKGRPHAANARDGRKGNDRRLSLGDFPPAAERVELVPSFHDAVVSGVQPAAGRLGAEHFRGEGAPKFVLYEHTQIDSDHPFIVDPATFCEIYRWYDFNDQAGRWLLLSRRREPRWWKPPRPSGVRRSPSARAGRSRPVSPRRSSSRPACGSIRSVASPAPSTASCLRGSG